MIMKKELMYFNEQENIFKDRIERAIQENRKGTVVLKLRDKSGNEIKNAKVKIEQKSHDFKFGCNIFMLDSFETEEKEELYKEFYKDIFNLAIVPFYWGALEPVEGKPRYSRDSEKIYRRPPVDLVLDFCRENNIEPKGHTLIWQQILPDWIALDGEEIKKQIDRRFRDIAQRYSDEIYSWDVTNEALVKCNFPEYIFPKDYVYWSFKQAEKYFMSNKLFINDVTETSWHKACELSAYSLLIENLLLRGINLEGIGLQYHMFHKKEELHRVAEDYFNPSRLFDVLDNYGKFNLPIHVSELTIPSYDTDEESEDLQAELVKNLYRLWFSHPSCEAIIWWNLVDGYAQVREDWNWDENYFGGGLIKKDFTPKKSYKALHELIKKEWHTSFEGAVEGDKIIFNGFYGSYDVSVSTEHGISKSGFHLSKTGAREIDVTL